MLSATMQTTTHHVSRCVVRRPHVHRERTAYHRFLFICRCGLEIPLESDLQDPTDENGGCPKCHKDIGWNIYAGKDIIA